MDPATYNVSSDSGNFEVHPIGTAQRLAELERDAARLRFATTHSDFAVCKWCDDQSAYIYIGVQQLDAAMEKQQ